MANDRLTQGRMNEIIAMIQQKFQELREWGYPDMDKLLLFGNTIPNSPAVNEWIMNQWHEAKGDFDRALILWFLVAYWKSVVLNYSCVQFILSIGEAIHSPERESPPYGMWGAYIYLLCSAYESSGYADRVGSVLQHEYRKHKEMHDQVGSPLRMDLLYQKYFGP